VTPEEREIDLWNRGHVNRPDGYEHNPEVIKAIRAAEDAALERAAIHLEAVAPLSILISEGSPTECGLKTVMRELRGLQAAAIRELKGKP